MLELTNDVWRKKNKLRPTAIAIPTIFKHKVYDVINLDGTTVNTVQRWKELKQIAFLLLSIAFSG